MLGVLCAAVVFIFLGSLLGPHGSPAYVGSQFHSNLFPDWTVSSPINYPTSYTAQYNTTLCSNTPSQELNKKYGAVNFGIILGVFFPAVSGIMAGANVSGDLKDPSSSIPTGTLASVVLAALLYILLVIFVGSIAARSVVVSAQQTTVNGVVTCTFGGLYHDSLLLTKVALSESVVLLGIYSATLSSGLSSLVGAPRILQALSKDRLFPFLNPFAKGVGASKEPRRAYIITVIVATLCIMTGDINAVAPLITTFFLSSYALVNYACFALETAESPGWRPSFKYNNAWVSLSGALGCVVLMLLLSAVTGFITFVIGLALYKYIEVTTHGVAHWGPARDAIQYNTALQAMLGLEADLPAHNASAQNSTAAPLVDPVHVKNYRVQCVVLSGVVWRRPALALLAKGLKKGKGCVVFADVLVGDVGQQEVLQERARRLQTNYVKSYGIKAFSDVVIAKSFREGCRSLIQLSGLGRTVRTNTVILGFLDNWRQYNTTADKNMTPEQSEEFSPAVSVEEYVGVIGDSFDLGCGVAILRGESALLNQDFLPQVSEILKAKITMSVSPNPKLNKTATPTEAVQRDESASTKQHGYSTVELHEFNTTPAATTQGSTAQQPKEEEDDWEMLKPLGNVFRRVLKDPDPEQDRGANSDYFGSKRRRIDVYCFADDGGLVLLLPHLLSKANEPPWANSDLRVLAIGMSKEDAEVQENAMRLLLHKLRIKAQIQVISIHYFLNSPTRPKRPQDSDKISQENRQSFKGEDGDLLRFRKIGEIISVCSSDALLVVVTLPVPPIVLDSKRYMEWLEALSGGIEAPVLFVRGSNKDVLTASS